jgi:plastocyanin domain-containing protein
MAIAIAVVTSVSLVGCRSESVTGPIAIRVDDNGFTPPHVAIKHGAPASLVFTRTSEHTCATSVVFPELKIEKKLPMNEAVAIDVPTGQARTLTFQCGMGMFISKAVIE